MDFDRVEGVASELEFRAREYRRLSQEAAEAAERAEKSDGWQTPEDKAREVVLHKARAELYTMRASEMEDMSRRLYDALYPAEEKGCPSSKNFDSLRFVMADMWHRVQEYRDNSPEMLAVIVRAEQADCWKTAEAKARGCAYYGEYAKGYKDWARELEDLEYDLRYGLFPEEYEQEEEEEKEGE
jgi:hypothetical protein